MYLGAMDSLQPEVPCLFTIPIISCLLTCRHYDVKDVQRWLVYGFRFYRITRKAPGSLRGIDSL